MLRFLLIGMLLLGPAGNPRLALSVSPRVIPLGEAYRKGIRATIRIEPDPRNRGACLSWDSEDESGSHCFEINELPPNRTTEFIVKVHHPGTYDFVFILQGTDGRMQTPSQTVEVN